MEEFCCGFKPEPRQARGGSHSGLEKNNVCEQSELERVTCGKAESAKWQERGRQERGPSMLKAR